MIVVSERERERERERGKIIGTMDELINRR
jgi:hypothetical protein